jgi:hypothetical protein
VGEKQDCLRALIAPEPHAPLSHPRREAIIGAGLSDEVMTVYRNLGGIQQDFPDNYGRYDVVCNGLAVELDEERHFNRYRLISLNSPLYNKVSIGQLDMVLYRGFCTEREPDCPTYGGNWTNPSCERQFGPSPPRGIHGGAGPARWRQRAFYDFLKDIAVLCGGPLVVRLSIYDRVLLLGRKMTIGKALTSCNDELDLALAETLSRRITSVATSSSGL